MPTVHLPGDCDFSNEATYKKGHRGKMHCARAVFLLLVNAPLLKTIDKNNKLGFRPRILKNLSSRHQT